MWAIEYDHTENQMINIRSHDFVIEFFTVGKTFPVELFDFKIYDDDGELYLSGKSTDDSDFGPLDDFGMPSYGATEIRYKNKKTGRYETL